jgi:hypothetical protein
MLQTTMLHIKGADFDNDALTVIKDYKSLLAAHESCQGIWRFDVPEFINLDAQNGILSVESWKDNGPLLSFNAGAAKATLVSKAKGGTVALVPSGTSYLAGVGAKINGILPYSIVVIAKPNSYAAQMAIAGAPVGAGGGNIRVESLTGSSPLMRNVRGAALPNTPVLDAASPVAFIASYDGTLTRATNMFAGSSTSATAVTSTSVLDFLLGSSGLYPFAGEVDLVALFSQDVTQDAALYTNLKAFAKMRLARL